MITREEMKIGSSYLDGYGREKLLIYLTEKNGLFSGDDGEFIQSIEYVLRNWSLIPKPKKKLELVTFLHNYGFTREVLIGSDDFVDIICKTEGYTRISSRTIEVEDDK